MILGYLSYLLKSVQSRAQDENNIIGTNLKGTTAGCTWIMIGLTAPWKLTDHTCPKPITMIASLDKMKQTSSIIPEKNTNKQ